MNAIHQLGKRSEMNSRSEPVRVLFVCMGNICRSPAAEAVMRKLIEDRDLTETVIIDSAGTLDYHTGRPSDPRICTAGTRRGYRFDHLARQVRTADFQEFDYILAMDRDNLENLEKLRSGRSARAELSLLLSHCQNDGTCEVPDPYYGGNEGFEHVMDLVEAGCTALLDKIVERHALS